MKSKLLLLTLGLTAFSVVVVVGQGQAPAQAAAPAAAPAPLQQGPGVQAQNDARYRDWVTTKCKMPPTIPTPRGGAGAAPVQPQHAAYTVTEIPGIIAAGQQWKTIWTGRGNNADGIIGTKDGGIFAAQNTDSKVMKIDKDGKASFPYTDTNTSGSVSMNKKGKIFIASRMLPAGIFELKGKNKKPFATLFNGEPIDCIGGTLNDMVAAANGSVYFTMGGLYHANKKGEVTKQGTITGTNGLALSPDEKTLYVTGRITSSPPAPARGAPGAPITPVAPGTGGNMIAYTIQPDGSLTNERQFATVGGDGATVDSMGRVWVTQGATVQIVGPDGKFIGAIPSPLGLITAAISGPDKKTLYGVANNQQYDEIMTIPILAQGYKDRGK